jgi:hypothetical protein
MCYVTGVRPLTQLVFLVAWCMLQHNERVFHNMSSLVPDLVSNIVSQVEHWCRTRLIDRSHLLGA